MRAAIAALPDGVGEPEALSAIWEAALESVWASAPVWVHGDFAPCNLLVEQGRLAGVIDFGQLAVGDPACDLAIGWTFLGRAGRAAFRAALDLDEAAWRRGRAWAAWKAAILASGVARGPPADVAAAERVLREVVADDGG